MSTLESCVWYFDHACYGVDSVYDLMKDMSRRLPWMAVPGVNRTILKVSQ